MYSNEVSLGHGTFGFEAAAEFYFGKHLSELTLPEAVLLAGAPQNPPAHFPTFHPRPGCRAAGSQRLKRTRNPTGRGPSNRGTGSTAWSRRSSRTGRWCGSEPSPLA